MELVFFPAAMRGMKTFQTRLYGTSTYSAGDDWAIIAAGSHPSFFQPYGSKFHTTSYIAAIVSLEYLHPTRTQDAQ